MGMAVDWVGRNLYWTDEGMQAIYVAALGDGEKKKILLHENMTHPRSVIVDPGNICFKLVVNFDHLVHLFILRYLTESGLLYWTDWLSGEMMSRESGKIESAWMDGTHRKLVIGENTRYGD